MRRANREVKDLKELEEILKASTVCRLAMQDEEGLYIVPMNYGYELKDGRLVLYLHSAKEGRKVSIMTQPGNQVAFEMDGGHKLIEGETPCQYGYSYQSITGKGTAVLVEDPEEKKHGLSVLMRCQTGKTFAFTDAAANSVAVFRIEAETFTGKRHG